MLVSVNTSIRYLSSILVYKEYECPFTWRVRTYTPYKASLTLVYKNVVELQIFACYIFISLNFQSTSLHLQSIQQPAMLISNPEKLHHRKSCTIKYKWQSWLKIEQYYMENNVSVETLCQHYVTNRRYYIHWKMQMNLLPDGVTSNVWKLPSGLSGLLLLITNMHVCMLLSYMSKGSCISHPICGMTFKEFQVSFSGGLSHA